MPRGISINCASVRDWALRNGVALRKLVAILNGYTDLFLYSTDSCKMCISSPDITISSGLLINDSSSKASKFKKLCRRTTNSHDHALKELKEELHMYLPEKKRGCGKNSSKGVELEDSHHKLGH